MCYLICFVIVKNIIVMYVGTDTHITICTHSEIWFYPESIFHLTNPVNHFSWWKESLCIARVQQWAGFFQATDGGQHCLVFASWVYNRLPSRSKHWTWILWTGWQVTTSHFCRPSVQTSVSIGFGFSVAQYHLGTITRGLVSRLRGLQMVWRSQYLGPRLLVILPRLCRSFQMIKTNSWTWGCSALTSTIKECFHACRYWCIVLPIVNSNCIHYGLWILYLTYFLSIINFFLLSVLKAFRHCSKWNVEVA